MEPCSRGASTHVITVNFKLKVGTISKQKDKGMKDKNKQFTNEKKKPECVTAYEIMGSLIFKEIQIKIMGHYFLIMNLTR